MAQVGQTGFRGLLIGAPRTVAIDRRDTLPIQGYFVRSLREDRVLRPDSQMLAVAVDRVSGRVTAAPALIPDKQPIPTRPPAGDPGEGTALTSFATDLRRALGLPWEPGSYRVTFILGGMVSDSVVVSLEGSGPGPAADRSLDPPPFGSPPFECAPGGDGAPPVPAGVAITLAAPDPGGARLVGSFRLPQPDAGASVAPALTLVITGRSVTGPWAIPLRVTAAPDGGAFVTGRFTLDLADVPARPRVDQDCFVYAFAAEACSGPVLCRLTGD